MGRKVSEQKSYRGDGPHERAGSVKHNQYKPNEKQDTKKFIHVHLKIDSTQGKIFELGQALVTLNTRTS